ncbi:hypothetical protein AMTR_s00065p00119670 [Amborella trichopoda]|uniref:Uncharacterized protein n=1 Tax=Amborella trichopoda TaxID=13333 RepID=U5DAX6_AMBTC|nr:hypothetical protein AMTR_s00065p00119670 [Amborella trichopoda]
MKKVGGKQVWCAKENCTSVDLVNQKAGINNGLFGNSVRHGKGYGGNSVGQGASLPRKDSSPDPESRDEAVVSGGSWKAACGALGKPHQGQMEGPNLKQQVTEEVMVTGDMKGAQQGKIEEHSLDFQDWVIWVTDEEIG